MSKHSDWVTASEVASYLYCPEAWRLEHGLKMPVTKQAEKSRERGTQRHERWEQADRKSGALVRVLFLLFVVLVVLWLLLGLF